MNRQQCTQGIVRTGHRTTHDEDIRARPDGCRRRDDAPLIPKGGARRSNAGCDQQWLRAHLLPQGAGFQRRADQRVCAGINGEGC